MKRANKTLIYFLMFFVILAVFFLLEIFNSFDKNFFSRNQSSISNNSTSGINSINSENQNQSPVQNYNNFENDSFVSSTINSSTTFSSTSTNKCDIQTIDDIVHGGSMSGIVENGQQITILKNYYACHEVQRNDLVIYNYAGNPEPLIKIVRAIPKDKWSLKLASQGYEIIVNGKVLTNSLGEPYQIPTAQSAMLKLYASSYPIIPDKTYLILGNLPAGTLDSSRFGLVGLQDIIGKAIIK